MHRQKQQLLLQILQELAGKRNFAETLIAIIKDDETPTTVFDIVLEFINRACKGVDIKNESKVLLEQIQYEIQSA